MSNFKTTWQHIRRAPYQALAAIAVMTLNLFITCIFFTTAFSFEQVLRFFESRPQVTAFFKDEAKSEEIEAVKEKLLATGKVSSVKYVSKEEALAIYREQNKSEPLLLEMVTANMLPASLEVSTDKLSSLSEVASDLGKETLVEEVIFQEDVVSSLSTATTALRRFGIALIAFTSLVSLLIILIITGMKIAARRDEIEILRLIGASTWYIRAPFLLEGAFYGFFGSILAWLLTYLLVLYTTPSLLSFLEGIPVLALSKNSPLPTPFMLTVLAGLVLVGLVIGVLGSFLSVKRYLR